MMMFMTPIFWFLMSLYFNLRKAIHSKSIYIIVANIATFLKKSCGIRNFFKNSLLIRKQSCGIRNFFLKIFLFFRKKHYNFVSSFRFKNTDVMLTWKKNRFLTFIYFLNYKKMKTQTKNLKTSLWLLTLMMTFTLLQI